MDNIESNLDYQFDLYLKRVALSESSMPADQYREAKRAFMGACGQLFFVLLENSCFGTLGNSEPDALTQNIMNQIGDYWTKEIEVMNEIKPQIEPKKQDVITEFLVTIKKKGNDDFSVKADFGANVRAILLSNGLESLLSQLRAKINEKVTNTDFSSETEIKEFFKKLTIADLD